MAKLPYNGFTGAERSAKSRERRRLQKEGKFPWKPKSRCELCGESRRDIGFHSEDYSKRYSWTAPAVRSVCKQCHSAIHGRFRNPARWEQLKAHIRRAGYASELKVNRYKKQLDLLERAERLGCKLELPRIRSRRLPAKAWWERLSVEHPRKVSARRRR